MKRTLFILILLMLMIIGGIISANAQKFKCENNTYSSTGRVKSNSSAPITTGYTWVDSKGISYPIFMSNSGSCYIIKTSKKTGKEYKHYLGADISQDICKKLGKEYKGKRK